MNDKDKKELISLLQDIASYSFAHFISHNEKKALRGLEILGVERASIPTEGRNGL